MISFGEFAAFLEKSAARCEPELEIGLAKIGGLQQSLAAEYIGHELPVWPPLAEKTVEQKQKLGYTGQVSATDPLLRTGKMRDSISSEVDGLTLVVGSTDPVAVYQEMGTEGMEEGAPIPPRPFLAQATIHSLDYAADTLGKTAVNLLAPKAR